ncbi:uncharacterized protein METZ01_LOCUS377465, partial [marine metagenome]
MPECLDRLAAMADLILLSAGDLRHGSIEFVHPEDGVVTEATCSGGGRGDQPLARTLAFDEGITIWWTSHQVAAETCRSPRRGNRFKLLEKKTTSSRVIKIGATKAGRMNARSATQRVDLKSGIISNGN